MDRRDISKAFVGIAAVAGAGAIAQKAQAQTCTAPCFAETSAEAAAGVTPTNYQYSPSHIGDDVRRYGNIDLTGATDCSAILNTANSVGVALYFPPGMYLIGSSIRFNVPLIFDFGAILKPASSSVSITGSGAAIWAGPWQIFNLSLSGQSGTAGIQGSWIPMNFQGSILTEWFGAGQGGPDDSVAFNDALLMAANSGGINVQLLAKNYNIEYPVYMAGSSSSIPSDLPTLTGSSGPSTTADGSRITLSGANTSIIAYGGNSSDIRKEGIKNIRFIGSSSLPPNYVIQLSGPDYYDIVRCSFAGTYAVGIWFMNPSGSVNTDPSAGVYTEYCRAVKCTFYYATVAAVRYTTYASGGGGALGFSSFNGSGLQDCTVALNNSSQNAVIIDSGSVYNAPMSFQTWTSSAGNTLIINNSGSLTTMHGTMTVEGGTPTVPITLSGGNTPIMYAGTFNLSTSGCYSGLLQQCQIGQTNHTVFSCFGGRKTTGFQLSTTGTTNEPANFLQGMMRLCTIDIVNNAQNYYYTAVLLVQSDNSGYSGTVTVLQAYLRNPAAGYGSPTFTFGSGGIQIVNTGYNVSGIWARIESLQIGPGSPYNPNYTNNYGFAFI